MLILNIELSCSPYDRLQTLNFALIACNFPSVFQRLGGEVCINNCCRVTYNRTPVSRLIRRTGIDAGIGRDAVKALLKCYTEVIAVSRIQADLDSLTAECPSITPVCVDLADWDSTGKALQDVGPMDLLVNNAAVATLQPFLEATPQEFEKSFSVNVKAALHVAQIVARGMKSRGSGGSIVNVSSQASQCALQDHAVYCATKGALDMLTKVMALELGPHKIRVNSVNPTVVMTAMGRIGWSDPMKAGPMMSCIPLGKFAEVEDVVNAILFLLSEKSAMITGATLPVDGGFLAC